MNCYVGLEGFTLPIGYIIKELTIIFPNIEYNHFIFEPPKDLELSTCDQKPVRYASRHLNSISYTDGDIPYENIDPILKKITEYTVYTYSEVAAKMIQQSLPTTIVINTQDLGHQLPKELPNSDCFRLHNRFRYCAKAKAIAVKEFIETIEH